MATDLILGTAGHIDHGKTSLVRALTGVDTDRLPEEKKRGITIDLGFASLDLGDFRLGIVDVPGHEKFVRNMLAGSTSTDLALLVVAADDSVKPQTREHLDILRLLDLKTGVIALTKCDVAEPDWIELVEAEVRDLVSDTFLADAPIVQTSAHTLSGMDELKQALIEAAGQVAKRRGADSSADHAATGPFRMAVDRVFTVTGHGTVVTGSVLRGRIGVGDALSLEPREMPVRVRGLQNHDAAVEEVHRGQRAAVNLAGVHHDEIHRGDELASPGHLQPSQLITVQVHLLKSAVRPVKNRKRVRVHIGTTEHMASIVLHDVDQIAPGESAYAQLFLREPVLSTWGQPFVIRSESPVVTIGGGRVLAPNPSKLRRTADDDWAMVAQLADENVLTRAAAAIYFLGMKPWEPDDLARTAGADNPQQVYDSLVQEGDVLEEIVVSPTRKMMLHRQQAKKIGQRIESALARMHADNPRQLVFDSSQLASRFEYLQDDLLYRVLLQRQVELGQVELSPRGVALAGQGPKLSKNEKKLLQEIIEQYFAADRRPPSVADVKKGVVKNQAAVPQLIELAAAQGHLVQLTGDLYLHVNVEQQLREILQEKLAAGVGLTVSQIREILDTSRKYAVPICEYFDRVGFTRRNGDVRVLVGEVP